MRPSLLACTLLVGCVTSPDDVTSVDHAIIGGQTATSTEFPTVVALQRSGDFLCTGVLVDKDYVLSAASCFDNTSGIKVRIGDANIGDGTTQGLTIDATTITKHPQFSYSDTMWRHDIAVVKLAQAVTTVTPSPIKRDATAVGAQVMQAGFGSNNSNGNGRGVLRSLSTTSVDCAQAGDSGITNANLLCFDASDGNGGCIGDGGSPSFVGGAVTGLGSGGTGDSCTQGLDVSTHVAAELGFIDQYVPVPTGTTPTPPPPTTPPPPSDSNPDGTGPGRDPGAGGDGDGRGAVQAVNCNAGGSTGGLLVFALLALVLRRRR